MVRAKELRIGNWYCLCNPMNRDDMDFTIFDNWTQALDFEAYALPIPLTPEILEKCGFEKVWLDNETTKCWSYSFKEFHLHILGNDLITFMTRKINFVHQLQNLYFALTGEELNYKP